MPNNSQNCSKISEFEEDDGTVTLTEVQRILNIFVECVKDVNSFPQGLSAISSLLKNVKVISNVPVDSLLPSALTLLHIIKTICASKGTDKLRELSYKVLLLYPIDVLSTIITYHCSKVLELFEVQKSLEMSVTVESCDFLLNMLSLLPPERKKIFLEQGLNIWFGNFVPTIMMLAEKNIIDKNSTYLECLEKLADDLLNIDYVHCPQWQSQILERICKSRKFPLIIKTQLQKGSNTWHRLWIVIVKLLKDQFTRNVYGVGTPINSLLPIVEVAFRMNGPTKCRAFQCWSMLIENFSTEKNKEQIPKRVKLLLIPMRPNNARTEDTALAKFQTWWKLITKFQFKLGEYTNETLITFIYFAFGKEAFENNPASRGVSQLYDSLINRCLQAFAEIVGHENCDCGADLPKLNGKMLSNKLLACNFSDWMYTLKVAIKMASKMYEKDNGSLVKQVQILCVWRPFVVTIAELPPNAVRRDMFNGLIHVLIDLAENCNSTKNLPDILFSLILSLFEDNDNIRNVLLTMGEEKPLHKIISIIINPGMHAVYERHSTEEMVGILKPLTDLVVSSVTINWLLDNLPHCDSSLKVWTALVYSVKESQLHNCPKVLGKLLLWPVKAMHQINVDKYAAKAWCRMFDLNVKIISNAGFESDILQCITSLDEQNKTIYFKLCITICLLKNKLVNQEDASFLPELLQNLTAKMNDYREYEQAVPMLVDTIVALLNDVTNSENPTLAKVALNCVTNVLTLTISEIILHDNEAGNPIAANIFTMINNIFNAVDLLYKISAYASANCEFVDVLTGNASSLSSESILFKFLMSKMESLLLNCSIDTVKTKINNSIEMLNENQNKINRDRSSAKEVVKEFTSPDVKTIVKRSNNKQACIVNTVVENGEEYVVVKSNWKFNPRKLTENQKEKFQRKSDDIPALYQDLSQSQDEFKLSSWKTDSQDTITSSNSKSSKLTTNEDASSILKKMASSDVLPNIMENLKYENEKNHTSESKARNVNESECDLPTDIPNNVKHLPVSTPKYFKSPRMAFKDRVFQNVRNLIEKSSPRNDAKDEVVGENQLETPTVKPKNYANLINSAPSLIPADRPSRMKRKPKKFDDVQLFGLVKRRNSVSDITHSNCDPQNYQNEFNVTVLNESHKIGNFINIDKVNVNIDNNVVITEEIVRPSDFTEIKQNESAQDAPESEVTVLSQTKVTKSESDTIVDTNITGNNDKTQEIEQHVEAQDNQDNENIEIINSNAYFALNSETESNDNKSVNEVALNTPVSKIKEVTRKSATNKRKSRIEKELSIDMVEGNPFLNVQSEKRSTRKAKIETENTKKRKIVSKKTSKTKKLSNFFPKEDMVSKEIDKFKSNNQESTSITVEETQERSSSPEEASTNEDAQCSEDVIESTQDSTFTTVSKSTKKKSKRLPIAAVERIESISKYKDLETKDLQLIDCEILSATNKSTNETIKGDIELPQNKTAEIVKNQSELTENMDTEPVAEDEMTDDVIIIDDYEPPIIVSSEKNAGPETQEFAEADTQPKDPADFEKIESTDTSSKNLDSSNIPMDTTENKSITNDVSIIASENHEDVNKIASEPNESSLTNCTYKDTDVCSPFKDDAQRKQDFLNNTSEISPIKVQSPDKEKTSPTQARGETSSEDLIVKLSSPVQSNGEPFDKSGSPDFFIDDKISPDKRDQSPPRNEVSANSGSPSSSLSLKKNRPQTLRPSGRAAHMLGLCVPDSMNTIKIPEKVEPEETKKGNTSIPARRNLRVLYNAVEDNNDNLSENEERANFLKFKKSLPSSDSSPSVPILKRKLIDIVDDATASPASKRKRVSFHDPPVSTTVSVQKYIEPGCIKSPSSAHKRLERQMMRILTKSPKRLENAVVKLDTVLSNTVESFTEEQANSVTNDTNTSLDVTPAVEVVNTSKLNDTDPICLDLVDCEDPIENIATELSSPAMKDLFIKELEGKIESIGDLAKMTELEVNRLCIKAPKVQVAKQVLADYVNKTFINVEDANVPLAMTFADDTVLVTEIIETKPKTACVETQTMKVAISDTAMQTRTEIVKIASTQTNIVSVANTSMQTVESGYNDTSDVISSCLAERKDFVDKLKNHLDDNSIRIISEKLPTDMVIEILANKSDYSISKLISNKLFDRKNQNVPKDKGNSLELSVIKNFLCDRFDNRDLMLFCSQLLQQKVYGKPA